jgi:hypothetical protein
MESLRFAPLAQMTQSAIPSFEFLSTKSLREKNPGLDVREKLITCQFASRNLDEIP